MYFEEGSNTEASGLQRKDGGFSFLRRAGKGL